MSGEANVSSKLSLGQTAADSVSGGKTPSGEPGLKPWADQSYTPPEGRVGNLTTEQHQLLGQYREELRSEGIHVEPRMNDAYLLRYVIQANLCHQLTPNCLIRFLRARKWNIPAAKLMMKNAEKWRQEMKVDEIYESVHFTHNP